MLNFFPKIGTRGRETKLKLGLGPRHLRRRTGMLSLKSILGWLPKFWKWTRTVKPYNILAKKIRRQSIFSENETIFHRGLIASLESIFNLDFKTVYSYLKLMYRDVTWRSIFVWKYIRNINYIILFRCDVSELFI